MKMEPPRKEYIESINFFNEDGSDGCPNNVDTICKGVVETNFGNHFVTIEPDVPYSCIDMFVINDAFEQIDPDDFLETQLLNVSDDIHELKKNEKFAEFFELNRWGRIYPRIAGDTLYVKFETSKGNFYIVAANDHNGYYYTEMEYRFEEIESID